MYNLEADGYSFEDYIWRLFFPIRSLLLGVCPFFLTISELDASLVIASSTSLSTN